MEPTIIPPSKTVPIDHAVVDKVKNIPKGSDWRYYLCDMVRPVPVRQMVQFLDKHLNPLKIEYRLPYFQDLYLLENYFTLCLRMPTKVDKTMRRRLSDLFWVKKEIQRHGVEQFLTSLQGGDRFFSIGSEVIIPLAHRHRPGVIVDKYYVKAKNCYNYRVEYQLPITCYQRGFRVTVNKNDLLIAYSRYNEDRLRQKEEAPPPPPRKVASRKRNRPAPAKGKVSRARS